MYREHPTKKICGLSVIMTLAENKYWADENWKRNSITGFKGTAEMIPLF